MARKNVKSIKPSVNVEGVLFEVLRGPALSNVNSPLRGHSLLGDMYGYGVECYCDSAIALASPSGAIDGQLGEIRIRGTYDLNYGTFSGTDGTRDHVVYLPDAPYLDPTLTPADPGYVAPISLSDITSDIPGFFNGQVMSIVDGEAAGTTMRIIDHRIVEDQFRMFANTALLCLPNGLMEPQSIHL